VSTNLRPDEDGARQIVQRLGRVLFAASRERSRRVPQPLLHWGIVSSVRDRIQDFDGIGEERPQASDDKSVEIGRRDPLTAGTACRGASDEPAGDVVPISRSLLDGVGRRHGFGTGVEEDSGQQAWFGEWLLTTSF